LIEKTSAWGQFATAIEIRRGLVVEMLFDQGYVD
jgi:hypothetical protein